MFQPVAVGSLAGTGIGRPVCPAAVASVRTGAFVESHTEACSGGHMESVLWPLESHTGPGSRWVDCMELVEEVEVVRAALVFAGAGKLA